MNTIIRTNQSGSKLIDLVTLDLAILPNKGDEIVIKDAHYTITNRVFVVPRLDDTYVILYVDKL